MKQKRFKIGEVKDSVPVSTSKRRTRNSKYPFKEMNIGSSFDVSNPGLDLTKSHNHTRMAQTLRASARRYGRLTGKRFIVRMTEDGVRVWRIE